MRIKDMLDKLMYLDVLMLGKLAYLDTAPVLSNVHLFTDWSGAD